MLALARTIRWGDGVHHQVGRWGKAIRLVAPDDEGHSSSTRGVEWRRPFQGATKTISAQSLTLLLQQELETLSDNAPSGCFTTGREQPAVLTAHRAHDGGAARLHHLAAPAAADSGGGVRARSDGDRCVSRAALRGVN